MIPILHRKKQKLEEVKERASEGELRPELRLSDLHLSLHTWPHTVSLKKKTVWLTIYKKQRKTQLIEITQKFLYLSKTQITRLFLHILLLWSKWMTSM